MDGVCHCPESRTGVYSVFEWPCTVHFYSVHCPAWASVSLAVRLMRTTSDRHVVQAVPLRHTSLVTTSSAQWWLRFSVWIAAISYLTTNAHYNSSALIPSYNSLSQFIEDTGTPSVPVRELNLNMPTNLIELKTPFQTWNCTQASDSHQPVSQQALWPINSGV